MDNNKLIQSNMPKVNPFNYPSVKCQCGNEIFVPGMIFKKVPGVLMGQGAEDIEVPIKVFYCTKCGELSPLDKEMIEKETSKNKKEENKSNLIL